MKKKNWGLIEQVLAYITTHEVEHRQNVWLDIVQVPADVLNAAQRVDVENLNWDKHDEMAYEDPADEFGQEIFAVTPGLMVGSCGTAACFAGWTTLINGDRQVVNGRGLTTATVISEKGKTYTIEERARRLLGLTSSECADLFGGDNTQYDIFDIINGWRRYEGLREFDDHWRETEAPKIAPIFQKDPANA